MIRIATPPPRPPRSSGPQRFRVLAPVISEASTPLYDRAFWFAYTAYALQTAACALMYRYADFVALLGGDEVDLGWIVGVGMIGSLATRLVLGDSIDRFGARIVWILATAAFVATCFAHFAVASSASVAIYVIRIAYCCAIAGFYGAAMTFVSARTPPERMAELIGMLGMSGFLGTTLGPLLGDFIFALVADQHMQVALMLIISGALAMIALPFVWIASQNERTPKPAVHQPVGAIIRRHFPPMVMMMGVGMGMGLSLPGTFLRTFAANLEISRIGVFFVVFSATAIVTRVATRRWFELFGNSRMMLLGMVGLAVSHLLFLVVGAEWQLIVPAIAYGASQAVLVPSVMAAAGLAFPHEHRGLAMVLILAMSDLGQLIGAPLTGEILHYGESVGLPPYPTLFVTMAALLAAAALSYALSRPKLQPAAATQPS